MPTNQQQIDEHKITALVNSIKVGNTFPTACAIAEISVDLARRWMALGGHSLGDTKKPINPDDAEEPYKSFARVVMTAFAQAEDLSVQQLRNAGHKDWRAALAWLQARNPDDWSPKKENNTTVVSSGGVQIILPDNGRDRPEIIDTQGHVISELPDSTG